MHKFISTSILFVALLLASGCATSGSGGAAGTSYQGEFSDVVVPSTMSVDGSATFITYAPGGIKCGVEVYDGRVEHNSLANLMKQNMLRDGWIMRSIFRAQRSAMVFEKPDRMCIITIVDGTIYTTMQVYVSAKLGEGDVTYEAPPVQQNAIGVETYPAGGFSSGVQQERIP